MKILPFLMLFAPVIAIASDDDLLPANRPNFSANGEVILYRMSILETGATYARSGSGLNFSGIEGVFRNGFAPGWEVNFSLPNYVTGSAPVGWTDGGFGFVHQLPSWKGWNMVIAAGSTLPTGQSNLTSATSPNGYFSMDRDIQDGLNLTETLSINWVNSSGHLTPSYGNALMVSHDCSPSVGIFAELFSQAAPRSAPSQTAHFGVTFAHTKDQQLDFHFGRNFSGGNSTNWFAGFGFSHKM